jgi:hypothetical protein
MSLLSTRLARASWHYGAGTVAAVANAAAGDGSGGARMQAPNSGSLGSMTIGDGQGSLVELLITARPQNRTSGNGVAGARERGMRGGEFSPP